MLVHRWTGLVAAPFFLLLCLTGGVLTFRDQVDGLLGQHGPPSLKAPLPANASVHTWNELARAAVQPGERPVSVYFDPKTPRVVTVGVAPVGPVRLDDAKPRLIDRETGQPIAFANPETSLTGYLLRLHAEWFAGFWGELFGGAVAVATLACLASGIPLYAPHVRAIAFGVVRRDRGMRVHQRDLHNLVGAVVLAWSVLIAGTGVLLAFSTLLFESYRSGELKAISTPHLAMAAGASAPASSEQPDVDRAVAAIEAAAPDYAPRYVIYPDTDYSGTRTFTAFLYGRHRLADSFLSVGIVGAHDGLVRAIHPLPLALMAVGVARPLHFGGYAGLWLKIIWVSASLATAFIICNGAWLWFHRRALHRQLRA